MALTKLIQFRKLDNELTDKEFFGRFCKSIGRETIASALYEHFKNNLVAATTATKIQSNILRKREDIPGESSSVNCIDKLPNECISECASWLEYKDYFHFGHCNRTIYYALYSPPKIQELNLSEVRNGVRICTDLSAFKNIQKLRMYIKDFNRLSSLNKAIWKNNDALRTLHLENQSRGVHEEKTFLNNIHLMKGHNVYRLTLSDIVENSTVFSILSVFDQIEYLKLEGDQHFNKSDIPKDIEKTLPRLKHLQVLDPFGEGISHLVNALCRQLESLHYYSSGQLTLPQTTFPNLQSFRCDAWNSEWIKAFEQTQTLQFMDVDANIDDIDPLFELMSKQKSFKKLIIAFPDHETNSYVLMKKINESVVKYGNSLKEVDEIWLSIGGYELSQGTMDQNVELGEQICLAFERLKSSGLKMIVKHFTMDMNSAGLSALNKLRTDCDVSWERHPTGFKVTIQTL